METSCHRNKLVKEVSSGPVVIVWYVGGFGCCEKCLAGTGLCMVSRYKEPHCCRTCTGCKIAVLNMLKLLGK